MQISKQSWHYKFMCDGKPFYAMQPSNLCEYFWKLVAHICLLPLAGLLFVVLVPVYPFVWAKEKVEDWWKKRKRLNAAVNTNVGNNLLFAYIKAKKRKICPLIEYVGETPLTGSK